MANVITTDRLVLRRFADADIPVVAAAMQRADVIGKLLWVPSPYSSEDARSFVTGIAQEDPGTFAITLDDALIGSISVGKRLGYWLVPEVWGRGFALEASRAVLQWHFAQDTTPVCAGFVGDHPRSLRILERLGFSPLETRQEFSAPLNRMVPFQDMRLSHAQWKAAA